MPMPNRLFLQTRAALSVVPMEAEMQEQNAVNVGEAQIPVHPFLQKCNSRMPSTWEKQSIYKVPPRLRELLPEAYEPLVVSIGPYHNGKPHLDPMEEHKFRALDHFLQRSTSYNEMSGLVRRLGDAPLPELLKAAYATFPSEWDNTDAFLHLMVLDGCFLLELLLTSGKVYCQNTSCTLCRSQNDPVFGSGVRKGLLPYIQHDLLLIENQLPMLVLQDLTKALNLQTNVNELIRKFYDLKSDGQPHDVTEKSLHVLDVYRRRYIRGDSYAGWTSPVPARHLNYHGVHFQVNPDNPRSLGTIEFKINEPSVLCAVINDIFSPMSNIICSRLKLSKACSRIASTDDASVESRLTAEGPGNLPVVAQGNNPVVAQGNNNLRRGFSFRKLLSRVVTIAVHVITHTLSWLLAYVLFWYLPVWVARGDFTLPVLVVDEATESLLLNLMAFERLHLGSGHHASEFEMVVTCYVLLMCSLLPSEKDVALLRSKKVLSCLPQRQDKDVVTLFERISKGIVVDTQRRLGVANTKITDLCQRQSNRLMARWYITYVDDLKARVSQILAVYGLVFTLVNSVFTVLNYVRPTEPSRC